MHSAGCGRTGAGAAGRQTGAGEGEHCLEGMEQEQQMQDLQRGRTDKQEQGKEKAVGS